MCTFTIYQASESQGYIMSLHSFIPPKQKGREKFKLFMQRVSSHLLFFPLRIPLLGLEDIRVQRHS